METLYLLDEPGSDTASWTTPPRGNQSGAGGRSKQEKKHSQGAGACGIAVWCGPGGDRQPSVSEAG